MYELTPDDIGITVLTCVVEVGQFLPARHGQPSAYESIFLSQTDFIGLHNIFCDNNRNFKYEVSGNILNKEAGKRGFSSNAKVPLQSGYKKKSQEIGAVMNGFTFLIKDRQSELFLTARSARWDILFHNELSRVTLKSKVPTVMGHR